MKRLALLLFVLMSVPTFGRSTIVTDSLHSRILGTEVKYNVYLPDGFKKSGKQYPVVYLLHGLYGTYQNWEDKGGMKLVLDELIGTGEAAEMVVIMPNAGHPDAHNHWNGYFNMPGWNYEDFFFQELVPTAEKKYRCISDKGHRAIMGLSMGGGGSTVYAQRHPEMFSSCYAMSAWLDHPFKDAGQPHDKLYLVQKSVREHSALDFVDNADEATIEQLRSVKWFFDCGDDDGLMGLSVDLYQKMRAKKIKSELRIRNGVHNWEYWHQALRLSLPFASRNFDR